jgi:hypothetical protein
VPAGGQEVDSAELSAATKSAVATRAAGLPSDFHTAWAHCRPERITRYVRSWRKLTPRPGPPLVKPAEVLPRRRQRSQDEQPLGHDVSGGPW